MLAEQPLGRERDFGGVEKEGVGAADDESISTRKGGSVDRTFNSQRLSRLDHRSRGALSLRGDTLDRRGCLLGVEILCGLLKTLGCAIGWEGRSRELCANEENKPEDRRSMAVYLEGNLNDILN